MFYEVCVKSKSRGCADEEMLPIISSMLLNIRSMSNNALIFLVYFFKSEDTSIMKIAKSSPEKLGNNRVCVYFQS